MPLWTEFMRAALDGIAESALEVPSGITTARIDPATGRLLGALDGDAGLLEVFKVEDIARLAAARDAAGTPNSDEKQTYEIF